jgi:Protein of unknown function (DUF2721)
MNDLSATLAILSAMIAPAVLISACGSLIIATSQRLKRAIDRVRTISHEFNVFTSNKGEVLDEELALMFELINRAVVRSLLLQRALICLYLTLSIFVVTNVLLGVLTLLTCRQMLHQYAWIPILLAMNGKALLLYSSLLLISKSRIALRGVNHEMDFVIRSSHYEAPVELLKLLKQQRNKRQNNLFKFIKF